MLSYNKSESKLYGFGSTEVLDYIDTSQPFLSILDLGCGNGEMGAYLKSMYGYKVTGVTISEDEFNAAKNQLDEVYIYNFENGLPDQLLCNKYDVILLSHVLEHICYPDILLEHIKIVCNDNCQIIVAIPNLLFYKSRFKILFGIFDYANSGIYDYTHFRWYTLKTLKKLFLDFNFDVKTTTGTISLPFGRVTNYIQFSIFGLICKYLLKIISIGFFSWEIILVANNRKH